MEAQRYTSPEWRAFQREEAGEVTELERAVYAFDESSESFVAALADGAKSHNRERVGIIRQAHQQYVDAFREFVATVESDGNMSIKERQSAIAQVIMHEEETQIDQIYELSAPGTVSLDQSSAQSLYEVVRFTYRERPIDGSVVDSLTHMFHVMTLLHTKEYFKGTVGA